MRPNIDDEQLIEAVEQASDELGVSKTEAVRIAIRETLVNQENNNSEANNLKTDDLIDDPELRQAQDKLWTMSRPIDGESDIRKTTAEAAESVLSQEFGIDKGAVRHLYLDPLRDRRVIDIKPRATGTIIVVVDPEATVIDPEIDAVSNGETA